MTEPTLPGRAFPDDHFLFNQGEAAEALGISRHLVKAAITRGDLDTRRVGGMTYVTRASLQRYRAWLYAGADLRSADAGPPEAA